MLTKMSRAELEKRKGKLRGHVMDDSIDPGIFCAGEDLMLLEAFWPAIPLKLTAEI